MYWLGGMDISSLHNLATWRGAKYCRLCVCLSNVYPLTYLKSRMFRLQENFLYVLTVPVACIVWHTSSFEDICYPSRWWMHSSAVCAVEVLCTVHLHSRWVHLLLWGVMGLKSAVPDCLAYCIALCCVTHSVLVLAVPALWYGDGAGNTVEENSSVFSLIQMR